MKVDARNIVARGDAKISTAPVFWFLIVFPIFLVVSFFAQTPGFGVVVALIALVTAGAVATYRFSVPEPRGPFLFTPVSLLLLFLAVSSALVPLFWSLNWAQPWSEIATEPIHAIVLTSGTFLVTVLGAIVARPPVSLARVHLRTNDWRLNSCLVLGVFLGLVGYFSLAFIAGGPDALLHSLADRRALLSGTGPLRVLLSVSGVACVFGAMHKGKTRIQTILTIACAFTYVVSTLLTGSRYQALVLGIALAFVGVRVRGTSRRLWFFLVAGIVAVVPLSTFYGTKIRSGLTYNVTVGVVDAHTLTSFMNSLVGPFVRGGLDTIRTTGVLPRDLPLFRWDVELYLGSVGNLVPRALWADKPLGASTQFSQIYFPDKWAEGTGVPPSVTAEALHSFGLIGGLFALFILGFSLARFSAYVMRRENLFWVLLVPFIAADFIQFAKGGSDGFIRTLAIHLLAVLVFTLFVGSRGTTFSSVEGIQGEDKMLTSRSRSPHVDASVIRRDAHSTNNC